MQIALFGIDNDALNLTVNLLVLLLVVVWLALVAWTYFDARRRLEDPILVWCAVGASLFPFIGTIVYTILRPPEFIEDRKERDLEIRAAELRVRQLTEQSCPNCGHPVEKNYLRCPECQTRIKDPCPSCEKPIDPRWAMCPYCETPIRREQPRRRSSERRPRREETRPRRRPSATDSPSASALSASKATAPKKRAAPKREKRRRRARTPQGREHLVAAGERRPLARRARSRRPTPTPLRSTPRRATARATSAPGPPPRAEPRRSIAQCPGP